MKTALRILAVVCLLSLGAFAQLSSGNITASGSAACNGGNTTSCVALPIPLNWGSAVVNVSGTFSATLQFEVTNDTVNWKNVSCSTVPAATAATSTTATGVWTCPVAGMSFLQVRASAYVSGTAIASLSGSMASVFTVQAGLPSGLTYAAPTLTVSTAGAGSGSVALSGNTSGTCALTVDATSTTVTSGCANFKVGTNGGSAGILGLNGSTSGTVSLTAPAVAGTATNAVTLSNTLQIPAGTVYAISTDTGDSRIAAGVRAFGNGTAGDISGTILANGNKVVLTADWTCGTGGTVSSCVAATIIGSGGGVPMTFTLPLVANSYQLDCDFVVGQATAATSNQWNLLTATNGATNVTASYTMATAATAMAVGAVTDQASTTTTFQIAPNWTLGGTGTKMPVHIHAAIEGASASGTVLSVQLLAPTVGDLVTIYRGSQCSIH